MAEVNEAKREKSQVEDINRSLYDFRYEEKDPRHCRADFPREERP